MIDGNKIKKTINRCLESNFNKNSFKKLGMAHEKSMNNGSHCPNW